MQAFYRGDKRNLKIQPKFKCLDDLFQSQLTLFIPIAVIQLDFVVYEIELGHLGTVGG